MTNHPNRATTYTVLDHDGEARLQNKTLEGAAQSVMNYDGHEYEIRKNDGRFELFTSTYSRNSTAYNGLARSVISSNHTEVALAEADIYRQVIRNAGWWHNQRVLTDADYAAELCQNLN
jgi:hypothetical protein